MTGEKEGILPPSKNMEKHWKNMEKWKNMGKTRKNTHLKMYLLLNMVIFQYFPHCHVRFRGVTY